MSPPARPPFPEWDAWSALYLRRPPAFLIEATYARVAERLLRPLAVPSIDVLRARLRERMGMLPVARRSVWYSGIGDFDPSLVGTR